MATSLRHNQLLAEQLGNQDAITLQYQSGTKAELYAMSVGDAYQILIFFTAETRRGRVGTVWVFAQRLVKELLPLLPTRAATPFAPAPEAPTILHELSPRPEESPICPIFHPKHRFSGGKSAV
ncbi:MAG: hypothetical protein IPL78_09945 [Chloroflexi bacterium]|nr:hypothetical protein [Chloroflexota bacterium]